MKDPARPTKRRKGAVAPARRPRGRPIDWEERRRKSGVLLEAMVDWKTLRFEAPEGEDPRIIEAEFRQAVIERLSDPKARKNITTAMDEAAALLGISFKSLDKFVHPSRKKKR